MGFRTDVESLLSLNVVELRARLLEHIRRNVQDRTLSNSAFVVQSGESVNAVLHYCANLGLVIKNREDGIWHGDNPNEWCVQLQVQGPNGKLMQIAKDTIQFLKDN